LLLSLLSKLKPVKLFKRLLLVVVIVSIGYGGQYAWRAFPIISGYGAKDLCSCVLVAGRDPSDVIGNELNSFPLKLGSFAINYSDSSATGSVFGLAKRKAIYRKGLGCTLLVEMSEEELRNQKVNTYKPSPTIADTLAWPMGDKLTNRITDKIDSQKLALALGRAFEERDTSLLQLRRTRAVVVLYDGQLVAEKYAKGFDRNSRLIGWSMTKSITNAMVGILVKEGKLDVNAPAPIAEWKNDDRKEIKLTDLLHMSSGLNWEENYGGPSGATNMLFKKKDMGRYAADFPLEFKPDAVFEYSSGTTNIISRIVREAVGDERYYKFPYEALFSKLGMQSIVIEPDAGGTFVGSSYSFATARDFARFGLLFLNDGLWQGERILPEGWVKYSSSPANGARRGEYGAQWWTNAGAKEHSEDRTYPDVPTDSFQAEGYEGQYIFVVPSKKLVVVRLGLTKLDNFDMNKLVSEVIGSLR
jgi:hypothetical protein